MANEKKRPIIVSLIAILYLLGGLLALFSAISIFIGGAAVGEAEIGTMGGVGIAVVAVILLILFKGFWSGWSIFWYIGVIASILMAATGAWQIVLGNVGMIVTVAIYVIVLAYMFSDKVKTFFLD